MKLGEALEKLRQLRREQLEIESIVSRAPLSMVPDKLDRYNTVIMEIQTLEKKCLECEMAIAIDNQSLKEINSLLKIVSGKLTVLEKVTQRNDLSSDQRKRLCEDLEKFRSTRDTLESSITRYLWETELLE